MVLAPASEQAGEQASELMQKRRSNSRGDYNGGQGKKKGCTPGPGGEERAGRRRVEYTGRQSIMYRRREGQTNSSVRLGMVRSTSHGGQASPPDIVTNSPLERDSH